MPALECEVVDFSKFFGCKHMKVRCRAEKRGYHMNTSKIEEDPCLSVLHNSYMHLIYGVFFGAVSCYNLLAICCPLIIWHAYSLAGRTMHFSILLLPS